MLSWYAECAEHKRPEAVLVPLANNLVLRWEGTANVPLQRADDGDDDGDYDDADDDADDDSADDGEDADASDDAADVGNDDADPAHL